MEFLREAFTGLHRPRRTILNPRAVKEKGKAYGRSPVGTGPFDPRGPRAR